MNVHSMLVRLQGTLGRTDLAQKLVLIPAAVSSDAADSEIHLVVGYSNSPGSQTALDLTLWIAHQTRLATGKQVTVQVVYVIEDGMMNRIPVFDSGAKRKTKAKKAEMAVEGEWRTSRTAIAELETATQAQFGTAELFEQADRILWNARCMAEEWRGSLKTHLRFGVVAKELKEVAVAEKASLLILGCDSADHPLVRQLGKSFPCPVLGIPSTIEEK